MELRPLGRTGLHVSHLSLGGAAIGQQYGPVSAGEVTDVIRAAVDAGVNLIDTAAYYGKGLSEELIGAALADGLRDHMMICTKAGRLDRAVFDFTAAGMRRCFEASLKRLRTDRVEVLLAHDIEFADDFERVFDETANVLHALKREGKCRFVGMSCYPLGLLRRAVERCELDVVVSYAHYTLQNTRLVSDFLPAAEARGVGVLNASPLALGLLTHGGPQAWNPAPPEVKAACAAAAELCRGRGADLAELGMQFCYAEGRIPSTITGTAKAAELAANLRALAEPIDAALLADVAAVLAPVKDHSWKSGNWTEPVVPG
ncbi:aldo/keto reductase [Urbifossiella limnaea]|uniref:D-threo-aldose 1-dehydrogenase n=1 Tax=Urbifossiella limnaea TaxID=2528023 RepID=A0A517XPG3_9BACT|nr:aldo/keto reductase [Urbifossiella limnaea]QDU19395.1 D-threo-aldose 1-dehydrogenase [Urbifossiella limnaea]